MKNALLLAVASFFFATGAFAQSTKPSADAPPPPGINDPGVKVAPADDKSAKKASQSLPSMHDDGIPAQQRHMSIPQVSVHQQGENRVQEYSRNGQVYMVVVTPKHGVPYSYSVDPDGAQHKQGEPPVHPVMYKVLEWGKSKPAEASSTSDDGG